MTEDLHRRVCQQPPGPDDPTPGVVVLLVPLPGLAPAGRLVYKALWGAQEMLQLQEVRDRCRLVPWEDLPAEALRDLADGSGRAAPDPGTLVGVCAMMPGNFAGTVTRFFSRTGGTPLENFLDEFLALPTPVIKARAHQMQLALTEAMQYCRLSAAKDRHAPPTRACRRTPYGEELGDMTHGVILREALIAIGRERPPKVDMLLPHNIGLESKLRQFAARVEEDPELDICIEDFMETVVQDPASLIAAVHAILPDVPNCGANDGPTGDAEHRFLLSGSKHTASARLKMPDYLSRLALDEWRISCDVDLRHRIVVGAGHLLTLEEAIAHARGDLLHTTPKRALARLCMFAGPYIRDLDLSRSYITGSAMSAVLGPIRSYWVKLPPSRMWEEAYPTVAAVPAEGWPRLREWLAAVVAGGSEGGEVTHRIQTTLDDHGRAVADVYLQHPQAGQVHLKASSGSDVDISIDAGDDDDLFDRIARGHFAVVQRHLPHARLTRVQRRVDYTWRIDTLDPAHYANFRVVEMYNTHDGQPMAHISTHHVPGVRACFTAAGGPPRFILTPSAAIAYSSRIQMWYNYFAGSVEPQEILYTSLLRGYVLPDRIRNWHREVAKSLGENPRWNAIGRTVPPSLGGYGRFPPFAVQGALSAVFRALELLGPQKKWNKADVYSLNFNYQ